MSSNDQTIAFLTQITLFGDGAVIGTTIACIAVKTWKHYNFNSSALNKIRQVLNVKVSNLRQLLEKEGEAESNSDGNLVVVRGIVEAKENVDGWRSLRPNVLVSNEAGERVVVLQNIQIVLNFSHLFFPILFYHKLQPVHPSSHTFLQAVFGHALSAGVDLAFDTKCLFWGAIILGSLSIGILGYATL
ncbi:hypothetical protein MKX01_014094, partial [Papaver californicum]